MNVHELEVIQEHTPTKLITMFINNANEREEKVHTLTTSVHMYRSNDANVTLL
jgi:hypothetical protein